MQPTNHVSRQIGALPLILDPGGHPDLCLVTTRGGRRWIIPKGNPIDGVAPHEVARREALEEAGLIGDVSKTCIGSFEFSRRRGGRSQTCIVDVYPLYVEERMLRFVEARERLVLRCRPDVAVSLVGAPSLAALITQYVWGRTWREAVRA